jgi:hypothetical protein
VVAVDATAAVVVDVMAADTAVAEAGIKTLWRGRPRPRPPISVLHAFADEGVRATEP